jgi:hypothetical protein
VIEDRGRAHKWTVLFNQRVTGLANLTNSPRGVFLLPGDGRYDTFAARTTDVQIGSLTNVKLRFGFSSAIFALGLNGPGLDLPGPLGGGFLATGDQDWGSVGYAIGAVAPNVPGNEFSILPPVGRVIITAPGIAGRDFTYQVYGAYLGGW